MAAQRQIAAKCANALRSTGPRSGSGRRVASQNARKTGVSSQAVYDSGAIALGVWLESIAASPSINGRLDEAPSLLEIVQSEAWMARIRAKLRAVEDRIDLLIALGDFKRTAPDAEGTPILQALGVPDTASATVRKAADRSMKDPGVAVVLDPVAALLRERALLMRYRQEADAARRSQLQHWAAVGSDRVDVAAWPPSDLA